MVPNYNVANINCVAEKLIWIGVAVHCQRLSVWSRISFLSGSQQSPSSNDKSPRTADDLVEAHTAVDIESVTKLKYEL